MSGSWSISNRANAGAAASASQAAPASGLVQGLQVRLRALQCRLSGASAGTDQLVIRDGASGAGAIIWTEDLSVPANGSDQISLTDLDIRATPGNALTVEFVGGVNGDRESVNAQGDYVPVGYPVGLT